MALAVDDFAFVQALVRRKAAIVLDPGKEYLVESRLLPLARSEGFASIAGLLDDLRKNPHNGLNRRVVQAMTTNETAFFRDGHPFEILRTTVIPEVMEHKRSTRRIDIWSAACSSGQEAVSIGMTLKEHFPQLVGWTVRILCTDLSTDMLARCRAGRYSQLEVNRGLPASLLVKHFRNEGIEWVASSDLRRMMECKELNLAEAWPVLPRFDVVFMRNVMIYFDVETKRSILRRLRSVMRPGGWLFLGGAETTLNLDDAWQRTPVGRSVVYRSP
ncbi:MAG: protein-glutamate O-methyltransferase CheR [Gemmatimonadales bacterium]|nr:MAG: protein-glutamate O-methyltransferase CheR [Gemmatimonadales bacterium]